MKNKSPKRKKVNSARVGKFAIVGVILALFNFAIYTFLARVIFNSNELLWLDSIISYILATILAYFMHSKITWKERPVTKHGIVMFFIWNGITAIAISPLFTWVFGFITPLYELAFNISSNIHLPFDYNFIESTGIFCLTTAATMILNYIFYDKLVFDDSYTKKFHLLTKQQFLSIILYLLPIIFTLTTVFLITTSCEDNFQGAGNLSNGAEINVITDATNAFKFNSRITDMYAWSVIDFYDYQYQFGPDTILRLIDAFMIVSVFYLATYLILFHRPKLLIKDALIFCTVFTLFIITPFGRAFYHEFSMIHNYVPLTMITLLFAIPYIKLLTGSPIKTNHIFLAALMLFAGLYFGMAATITPIAFIVTIILFHTIKRKSFRHLPIWFFSGLISTVSGFLICWLAGSGVDHYTNPSTALTFDYLPVNEIFSNIPRLLFHEIYNFGIVLVPLLAIVVTCLIFAKNRREIFTKRFWKKLPKDTKNLILVFSIFIIIHILGASLVKSPPRLLIPAYFAGLVIVFYFFAPFFSSKKCAFYVITLTSLVVIIHFVLLVKYHTETAIVLNKIKTSEDSAICISPIDTKPFRIPVLDLSQANIIEDWGIPEPIYNKSIVNCK